MLDELAAWELAAPVVLADAAYGEVNQFRLGLEQRQLAYLVQVPGTLSAYGEDVAPQAVPYAGRGRPPVPRYRQRRSSLRQLVLAASAQAATTVAWRQGADGQPLGSRFVALRVRSAGVTLRRAARGGQPPVRWLLAEWPDGERVSVQETHQLGMILQNGTPLINTDQLLSSQTTSNNPHGVGKGTDGNGGDGDNGGG